MTRFQRLLLAGFLVVLGGLGWESVRTPAAPGGAQNPAPAAESAPTVIKAETNLVVVDVIVTDKKGNYITNLEKNDFHIFEDDAEQPVASFSREADITPNAPERKRYMVLFFDDSSMNSSVQMSARQQAAKFVESTASANRMMAVLDFNGSLVIGQNFTADGQLLKAAVSNVKYSAVNPNAGGGTVQLAELGGPSLGRTQSDFAARSMLLSIRDVAKTLRTVPGRKTLILFSGGFALTAERQSELTATIDALNKSNIAVYPVDARGLSPTANPGMDISRPGLQPGAPGLPPGSELRDIESPFAHLFGLWAALAAPPIPDPQRGGVGGGGGGGTAGGSASAGGGGGGTRGSGSGGGAGSSSSPGTSAPGGNRGGGVTNPNNNNVSTRNNILNNQNYNNCTAAGALGGLGTMGGMNPNCTNRQIIPTIPNDVSTNQQVLYALAKGTGGFEIFNTNDFLKGLQNVSKEMSEYYNVGYTPPHQDHDGSYHKIRVKVDRSGLVVRYRTGYYDVKSPDLLKDKPEGKALEERVASAQTGDIPVSLNAPYFYVEPGVARVNLFLSVPGNTIDFEKAKGNFHSDVNVLGIAYRPNGSVAARFSDKVKLDLSKKDLKDFGKNTFNYQNTFNIAPGSYTLKLVLSSGGEKFGKYVAPLEVAPFTGDNFVLGGPALGVGFMPVSQLGAHMDATLLEDRIPLVFKDMELVPSTNCRFAKASQPVVYIEVYDPVLKSANPRLGVLFNIIDRKTNQKVYSSSTILINEFAQVGNPLVPVGFKLPMDRLQAGDYRFEITGRDEMGNVSSVRSADFSVE